MLRQTPGQILENSESLAAQEGVAHKAVHPFYLVFYAGRARKIAPEAGGEKGIHR